MSFIDEQLRLNPCAPDGVITGVAVTQPPAITTISAAAPMPHRVEFVILFPRFT